MKKWIRVISFFSLVCVASATYASLARLVASKTPTQAIKDLNKMVEEYRVGALTEEDKKFNQELKRRILRGTFDLQELSRLSLADHWNKLTGTEQRRFVDLLTGIIEERSLFAREKAVEKGEKSSPNLQYKKEIFKNKDKSQAVVQISVYMKTLKGRLTIGYGLKKQAEIWKIYDVIVDDASLVDNYRATFGNIIKKHGYAELVRRMQSKLTDLKAKRSS